MPFDTQDVLLGKRTTKSFRFFWKETMWFNLKYADISMNTFSIYCLYWDSKIPKISKMIVAIALKLILQQLKTFLLVRNKNSKNSENLEITPRTKFIIFSINGIHKLHKFARKTSGMKK